MILLLTMAAQAGGLVTSAGGAATLGSQEGPGLEVRFGRVFSETLQVELEGGVYPGGVLLSRGNLQITSARASVVRPTFGGGGGLLISDTIVPLAHIGPGLTVGLSERLALHADARYLLKLGAGTMAEQSAGELTVGLTWRWLRAEPPELVPAAEVAVTPVVSLRVQPPHARVWMPPPENAWLSVSDFERVGLRVEPGVRLRVAADGYLPTEITYEPDMSVVLVEAPAQGTLVVVSSLGDTLMLNNHALSVDADGVAVISTEAGRVHLTVSGGGREVEYRPMISNGHVTWLRVRPPTPTRITFELDSSTVSEEDIVRLQGLAAGLGDYSLILQGAHSPEGAGEHNLELAQQRAESVASILLSAGVPEERLQYQEPADTHTDVPLHKQRYVMIEPTGATP